MSTSTDGILAYGYNLGSEGAILVAEAKPSYFKTSWHDAEFEESIGFDGEEMSIFDLMVRRLYESIPDAPSADNTWDRDQVVKERLGVWFEHHCSDREPMAILTARVYWAVRGYPVTIEIPGLVDDANDWNDRLAHALAILEITPDQPQPEWLLCSEWG